MIINICYSVAGLILTAVLLYFRPCGKKLLGADRGRKFAAGSDINIGKPTGVGFYFILVFAILSIISCEKSFAFISMMLLCVLNMIFGFLDDRAKAPWGEYIKGGLDFLTAIAGGIIFAIGYGGSLDLGLFGISIELPVYIYAILATVLIIVSINATNATDGVDGLSGTLSVLTVITLMLSRLIISRSTADTGDLASQMTAGSILIGVLIAYLFFNHYPSKMLMGDAGSRAIGFFIAFYAMYLKLPVSYLILGLPFMLDGGLSILKITIGRLTGKRIIILKNITTPIHDHLKKRKGFSVPKTYLIISGFGLIIDIIYLLIIFLIYR